jgi:hypothetical protein
MNENERRFLNDLPEQVTIYRGCSQAEIKESNKDLGLDFEQKKLPSIFANEYRNGVNDKRHQNMRFLLKSNK